MTYEIFAAKMVEKWGFCNWQCQEAWNAALEEAISLCQTKFDVRAAHGLETSTAAKLREEIAAKRKF